jgi:hypothetical protein
MDEVLKTTPSLGDFTGREITVKRAQPADAASGEPAVFRGRGAGCRQLPAGMALTFIYK